METTACCYRCHRETARSGLLQFYVRKGFAGRDKAGYVLICPDCVEEARHHRVAAPLQPAMAGAPGIGMSNRMVAILSLLGMLALTALVVASTGRF
ncbi:hypothetical protein BKE38_28720 [Pseudoroseomonas deserti]|uniref:Uncharacterized protein n=1 Tax=Teichococcus deserti TaxID=1817963 RepID=A0A1V2GTL3_9PROT|nr:hypothetical protein [Pseudoroseomonas deserti]ONG43664.1 hypothetical protein BKE38_28720 [Pseudoroseomonas deserti]